ncbi:pirin family protein [bacterium]|nr:pirin family protein [bacterium]
MLQIRKSEDRGHANHGWLEAKHSFSFSEYYDPDYMGFRVLRVINQDRVAPGTGFATHGHQNMEIVTYITEGALEHKDTLGNTAVIRPGEVQRMSAGTGIRHSEFNHSRQEAVKLLQIWLLPEKEGIAPGYEQKSFADQFTANSWVLTASRAGREGSVKINQDVDLYVGHFEKGFEKKFSMKTGRYGWVQMVRGNIQVNGSVELAPGDGLAISDEKELTFACREKCEFLFFDLP